MTAQATGQTTIEDMRETTRMLIQPFADWDSYLTPAPLSIAIMGELVFVSVTDFSINTNPPAEGYKYLRDPESFRASLVQIFHSISHAFSEAQKNMDQVRLQSGKVPESMNTAVHTLFSATDEAIEILLPNQLKNICEIADDCVALAEGSMNHFNDAINLIQEVLEACVNALNVYEEEEEEELMKVNMSRVLYSMGRVNEQLEKTMHFFQMVSYINKMNLCKIMHNFVCTSEETKQLSANDRHFTKDLLYNLAFQASNLASLVDMISKTYTEVSSQYLMDRVSSLDRLIAMDNEDPGLIFELLRLVESCGDAREGIVRLVLNNKDQFERQTDARLAKIEGELKALAALPSENERIKEIVQDTEDDFF